MIADLTNHIWQSTVFAILVGETAKGRKGTSWSQVQELFRQVDPLWTVVSAYIVAVSTDEFKR